MKREVLRGYWYADSTPQGASVASAKDGSHVLLNGERIDVPAEYGGVLQVRISPDGSKCGGQAQHGNHAIEYRPGRGWRSLGPHIGPNSFIYRADGSPLVARNHAETGSQGYWYIDDAGRPVPSFTVYGSTVNAPRLYLHTTRGDITIGQGEHGHLLAWWKNQYRLIDEGDIEFIRFNRSGDQLSLAYAWQKQPAVGFLWLTVDELAQFTIYTFPVSVPVPTPQPVPQPTPEPHMPARKWTPLMPNRLDVVQLLKDQHPDEWAAMNAGPDLRFIKRLAATLHAIDPNFGLNGKRGNPQDLSEDCIAYKNPTVDNGPEVADVVQAHGSPQAQPAWINITADSSEGGAGAAWVKPEVAAEPPAPKPPAQSIDAQIQAALAPVKAQMAALKQRLDSLDADVAMLDAENDAIERRVVALENKLAAPLPKYRVVVGRTFGHSHTATLVPE